jgi:hypothetical protein
MPKKTKRQKILARERRHIPLPTSSPVAFHFQEPATPSSPIVPSGDREELIFIKKDLTKTLILALIAICIELGVYRMLRGI